MKNTQSQNSYGQNNIFNKTTLIGLSSNRVVLIEDEKELPLLDGDDDDMLLIKGDAEEIIRLVTKCYEAREKNVKYHFTFKDEKVTFC